MFFRRSAPTPTDLEILDEIYDRYYETYRRYEEGDSDRQTKVYVPVDLEAIAEELGSEKDIVFGRQYYDLQNRYGYKQPDGTSVPFFKKRIQDEMHVVHFPYLASVVADLRSKREKHLTATWISILSLLIAGGSLAISLLSGGQAG